MKTPVVSVEKMIKALEANTRFQEIRQHVKELDGTAYLVGGAIRDYLLHGQFPDDWDFAWVRGQSGPRAEALARKLADELNGHYVLLDPEYGIHRVVIKDEAGEQTLDISDALENDIDTDIHRRDVTVNAMALEIEHLEFLDPENGYADLENKSVRLVSEANLLEDPLRMLRVFRVAAQMGAAIIDADALEKIKKHKVHISESATERVHYEFLKLLSANASFEYLKQMGETGLLEEILPELIATRKIPPNAFHHLWLYDHTLELVNQAEQFLSQFSKRAQERLQSDITPFATRAAVVKLACLFHDLGKPDTMAEREDGRLTFYGHDKVSEDMTEEIAKRWKMSNQIADLTKKLVRWHLYPCQFGQDSPRRSVLKFFRRMGEDTPEVILLALADRFSTLGVEVTPQMLEKDRTNLFWLLEQYYSEEETLKLPRLLTGRDVMELLNISGGPQIGKILEALQEAHQLGEVPTEEAAREWVKRNF